MKKVKQQGRTIVKAQVRDDNFSIQPLWVRSHTVSMLTKWDFRMLERMRDEGNIIFEKRGGTTWYLLESIHRVWSVMKKFQSA